ncbi:Sec-independent protein translocase protein TatB [Gordonia phthalatica]|uniref:Sec-independent protein translocase protein TatB n=1 Tax=Gordonia phthalatica TaxID=1136941 RepID=A0A0N9N9Z9_9ACTN|nr:Sec-independent protein translocase protein TatB [Gordonia phthalatica]ALG84284.1 preprotein translocase subunit TatB [Gordonia phthalatica]
MFSSVGWGEILILLAAALIILGPERLPGAVSWVMGTIRKVRDYATDATSNLENEIGADFDDIRKPLSQLNELRQMTPKAIVTKHLFDGDSSSIDDMGKSVRETLDISRTHRSVSAPTNDTPKPTSAPAAAPQAPRHDVTDWDAT